MSLLDKILPELLEIIDDYRTPLQCSDCGIITFEILTCPYVHYHNSCYNCLQKCSCDIFIKIPNLPWSPWYGCSSQKSCRDIYRACVFVRPDNSHLYFAPGYKCEKCGIYYCSTCMNNTDWDDERGPFLCNSCGE